MEDGGFSYKLGQVCVINKSEALAEILKTIMYKKHFNQIHLENVKNTIH